MTAHATQETPFHGWAQIEVSSNQEFVRVQMLLDGSGLHHVSFCSSPKATFGEDSFILRTEDENGSLRILAVKRFDGPDPVTFIHNHIEGENIGRLRGRV